MTLAMTIFTVVGLSLYSLFNVLTTMESSSLGIQNFKNRAYDVLKRMEREISEAVAGEFQVFDPGVSPIATGGASPTDKVSITAEFRCLTPPSGHALYFKEGGTSTDALDGAPQIHLTKRDYSSPSFDDVEDYIRDGDGASFWQDVKLQEQVIFLRNNGNLDLFARNEVVDDGNDANYLDGAPDVTLSPNPGGAAFLSTLGEDVVNVRYLFWGDNSVNWNNDGSGANTPITEWDSTVNGGLPRAMKIVLVMNYNPGRSHLPEDHLDSGLDRPFVFEKVINFKYRQ
jgi:hypothetical protein